MSKMILFILAAILFKGVNGGLTAEMCLSHSSSLYSTANSYSNKADEALVPSKFARVVDGYLFTVVNETAGVIHGGGTNTMGFYSSLLFNGSEIFPDGICDIPTSGGDPRCGESGLEYTDIFLLGPADAIAFLICSPPPVRYFSFDVDIMTRTTNEYPFYPGQIFGDTINNLNINVTSTDTTEDNTVFDKPILVIHTADGAAAQAVADAYISEAGINPDSISIRAITTDSTVKLWDRSNGQTWHESQPDILALIERVSVPSEESKDAYELYKQLVWPARFYFADDEKKAADPLVPPIKSRYSDKVIDEYSVYSDSFIQLEKIVKDTYEKDFGFSYMGYEYSNYTQFGFYDDWDEVIALENNDSFIVPTRDAIYGIPEQSVDGISTLSNTTYGVIIGVLHSKVQNSQYSSIGLGAVNYLTGLYSSTNWFIDTDLEGSANRYFEKNRLKKSMIEEEGIDNLFALDYFPPGGCKNSIYPQWCIEFNDLSFELNFMFFILGERVYLVKETGVGPDASKTIPTRFLMFNSAEKEKESNEEEKVLMKEKWDKVRKLKF